MNRERDGAEIFICFSSDQVRPHLIQHMAELVIGFWEEDRFIDSSAIFEGDEFHGVPILGVNRLACDQSADGGYVLTYVKMKVTGLHVMQFL